MAKTFARRTSKRDRKKVSLEERINRDVFQTSDRKLLAGARSQIIKLNEIVVKEQVRTKFNDASLKDLSENIKTNGLIQPLVLHKEGANRYYLICGERRFRAMSLIKMKDAPCFILEDKSHNELMAIQFSENSSREDLHYMDKAEGVLNYQKATKNSERKIQAALGISKSEVHRGLLLAKLPVVIKEAAKFYSIEKYVLLEFLEIPQNIMDGDISLRDKITERLLNGKLTKRSQLKRLTSGKLSKTRSNKSVTKSPDITSLLRNFQKEGSKVKIDDETKALLKNLLHSSKKSKTSRVTS